MFGFIFIITNSVPIEILLYMIWGRFMYVFLLECWVRGIWVGLYIDTAKMFSDAVALICAVHLWCLRITQLCKSSLTLVLFRYLIVAMRWVGM